ncbi:hypothetical protein SRABI27_01760 [Pedobacter sp. Bi27]|uniref:WapI family immunity protein n=1 Tax=unclassified Pedobacter TaxID=2628915 RepID=UPI001DEB7B86|nr:MULTISPECIES: hypothetical protein [unclassified Pedobacter]CAH0177447.1 hypothetical protein SRABI36_01420 [Pedobacter sp. Bi36]CAH0201756.1 hypothetical protein SRABI27_01760 [Pedobacter sp. Bi27]CAH0233327.1 hypothetical protein SRABI126_02513 [Pedobacter sp. Bi126]
MKISINESQSEFVEFEIEGKPYPYADDYWDGNHLKTYINLAIPAFKGAFVTNLQSFELSKFLEELDAIGNMTARECVLSNVGHVVK